MKKQLWALIGSHKPLTLFDKVHVEEVKKCMRIFGFRPPSNPDYDIINLEYGRDFLKEHFVYDVVITHSIYSFGHPASSVIAQCNTSDLHYPENWNHRLIRTEANFVFICEFTMMCMSAWKIGVPEGYELVGIPSRIYMLKKKGGDYAKTKKEVTLDAD